MDVIRVVDRGPVRTISLNRPEVRNALSAELRDALAEAVEEAASASDVRAVVLTGEGAAFCSGLDLRELERVRDAPLEAARADAMRLADLLMRIHRLPKPVVAAVRGPAVAGGAGLASACDVVIAGEGARLGYTEARIGFVAALVAVFLVRQVGDRRARELLLTARLVDAAEAREIGLVNEVVADGRALARAHEVALAIAGNAPAAVSATKDLLASLPGLDIEDALRLAVDVNARARTTDDLREGVAAFLEKRAPAWRPAELDRDDLDA